MKKRTILITGGAGFIGYHLSKYLIENHEDVTVVAVDNLNEYYETQLKRDRLSQLDYPNDRYEFHQIDIADNDALESLFAHSHITDVVNLAAQAGVRYARENPDSYVHSNIQGFYTVIQLAVKYKVNHFLYASSSSVYGANKKIPFEETDICNTPMSLYAATKLSNEMMAAAYFYTHGLRCTGLRFFNVYGPWGRPDMAYYKWADAILGEQEIELRNNGEMYRDMTYIDDVVKSIALLLKVENSETGHQVYNVGNRNPVKISDLLHYLTESLGGDKLLHISNVPKGDEEPIRTFASTDRLRARIGFAPETDFNVGMGKFVEWYRAYTRR